MQVGFLNKWRYLGAIFAALPVLFADQKNLPENPDAIPIVIIALESNLVLEGRSIDVTNFDRYWEVIGSGGSETVEGVLIRTRDESPGKLFINPSQGLPLVFDGGCGVIRVTYARSVLEAFCSGFA